jgi:hypothetical protein
MDRRRRDVTRMLALPFVLLAAQPFNSSVQPLPPPLRRGAEGWLLARRLPGSADKAASRHRRGVGLRRPRPHRPARRQSRRRHTAHEGLPSALQAALPDPPHAPFRRVWAQGRPSSRRRHQWCFRVPAGGALPLLGRHRYGRLVAARLWHGSRSEPNRKSVRRLWTHSHARKPAVPRPLTAAPRNGDAGGRSSIPVDWLGLGRRLDWLHQGLHALLLYGALSTATTHGRRDR